MLKKIFFVRLLIVSVFFSFFVDIMAMKDDDILKEKQQFLRENILEKGHDADYFMSFLTEKKGEGGLDLNNWNMFELQDAVKEFNQPERQIQEYITNDGYNADNFTKFLQSKNKDEKVDIKNLSTENLQQAIKEFKKEQKQQFLQEKIVDEKYDQNSFYEFLTKKKEEGGNDLNNWNMTGLQGAAKEFKQEQKQQFLQDNILGKEYDIESFYKFLCEKKKVTKFNLDNWSMLELQKAVTEFQRQNPIEKEQKQLEEYYNGNINHAQSGVNESQDQNSFYQLSNNKFTSIIFDSYRYGGKILTSLVWSVVNSYYGFEEIVMNDWYCFKYAMCSGYRLQPRFIGSDVWIDINFNFLEGIAGFLIRCFLFYHSYTIHENIFDFFNVCIDIKVYNNLYLAVNVVGIVRSFVLLFIHNDSEKKPRRE